MADRDTSCLEATDDTGDTSSGMESISFTSLPETNCCNCCQLCRERRFEQLSANLQTPGGRELAKQMFMESNGSFPGGKPRLPPISDFSDHDMMSSSKPSTLTRQPSARSLNPKVARFYDWTTLSNCISINQYDPTNNRAFLGSPTLLRRARMKQWYSTGVRALTGRMFVREKTTTTKGEREIISGICQNRGDLHRDEIVDMIDGQYILSHHDAWLIGKQLTKNHPMVKFDDPTLCTCHFDSEYSVKEHDNGCAACNPSKLFCDDCVPKPRSAYDSRELLTPTSPVPGICAPPGTPDLIEIDNWRKKRKVPPINSGKGAVYVKQVLARSKDNPDMYKRKTLVDVYLPRLGDNADSDASNAESSGSGSSPGLYRPPSANALKEARINVSLYRQTHKRVSSSTSPRRNSEKGSKTSSDSEITNEIDSVHLTRPKSSTR